jgi:two-component system, NtrC family, response regulator HydG
MKKAARVLVADDDHDIADSLAAVIEARGHSVSVAYSGGEATRLAHEKRFDIGFLDIMMPGRNGVECLFDIKRLQPGMTVYMMTGFSVADLIEQALAGGALGVLRKPVSPRDVLELLPKSHTGSVLIADEDGDLARSLRAVLTEAGWPVSVADTSDEAKLQAAATHLDAVIVDIDVPMLGGVEICAELWRMGRNAPTLVVTGELSGWLPVAAGSVCHLFKPVDPAMILSLIDDTGPASPAPSCLKLSGPSPD